jgi:hypothetical protein
MTRLQHKKNLSGRLAGKRQFLDADDIPAPEIRQRQKTVTGQVIKSTYAGISQILSSDFVPKVFYVSVS